MYLKEKPNNLRLYVIWKEYIPHILRHLYKQKLSKIMYCTGWKAYGIYVSGTAELISYVSLYFISEDLFDMCL